MNKTGISWTDLTWNPISGCSKVSPGCKNCYAEAWSKIYYETHKEKCKQAAKIYYETHKDEIKQVQQIYIKNNRDKINSRLRNNYSKNKQKILKQHREWIQRHRNAIMEMSDEEFLIVIRLRQPTDEVSYQSNKKLRGE